MGGYVIPAAHVVFVVKGGVNCCHLTEAALPVTSFCSLKEGGLSLKRHPNVVDFQSVHPLRRSQLLRCSRRFA